MCSVVINCAKGQAEGSMNEVNRISINQDKRIDQLIKKHIIINQQENGKDGFRVQLFFGSSKKKAMEIKALFIESYPNQEGYVIYDVPYFKVRAGDFRTRIEATKLQRQIAEEFPESFIVQDRIPILEIKED